MIPKNPNSLLVALLAAILPGCRAAPAGPEARTLESITLRTEDGRVHELDTITAKGTPVALVFWQTWCTTCREEGPALAEAAKRWSGEIEFFGVVSGPDTIVDAGELERLVETLALPYPQVRDRDGSLADRLGVQSTPTILVLGGQNKELYRGKSLPQDWSVFLADGAGAPRGK